MKDGLAHRQNQQKIAGEVGQALMGKHMGEQPDIHHRVKPSEADGDKDGLDDVIHVIDKITY